MGILWADSAEERISTAPFEGDITADLCVIGGGFTGCSAALHAAEAGARVVLLEAQSIGHGGSGRNVGLVNAGLWSPPETIARHLPAAQAEQLTAALAEAPALVFELAERHGIACEATRNGTLHLAHAEAGLRDLRDRHRQLTARGAPVSLLSAEETRRRTGTDAFPGALHDPRAGTVQPLAYARGLARAAQSAGAALHEQSPVTTLSHDGAAWRITTPGGTVRAAAVIVATNAYHSALSGAAMPAPIGVNFFQIATTPLSGEVAARILPGGEGCWDTALVMTALRRDRAGRLIVGGIGSLDAPGRGLHLGWAQRKLRTLFPALGDVEVTHAWTGRIAMTGDHLPRILRLGKGAYAAFGYSGRGIAPGTLFGKALAEAARTGNEDGLPLPPTHAHRDTLTGLRSAWIEAGATLTHAIAGRSG